MLRNKLSEILVWSAFSVGAIVFGGGVLETMVYIPNWFHDVPTSLIRTREFMAAGNPGDFFQLFLPLTLLLTVIAIIVSWPQKRVRWALIIGAASLVASEILTFNLVYPQIRILIAEDIVSRSAEEIRQAADTFLFWGFWVRLPAMFISIFVFYLIAARGSTVDRATLGH